MNGELACTLILYRIRTTSTTVDYECSGSLLILLFYFY
jgi:hypothetical protein